jgi:predicted nucleic acid-binding Zn ribbon protein
VPDEPTDPDAPSESAQSESAQPESTQSDPLALARDIADSYRDTTAPARPRRRRPAPSTGPATGRRKKNDDPVPLADAMNELIAAHGWDERLAVQRIYSDWPGVVGPEVAAHSAVEGFEDGILAIRADSTAWAKQLQLLAPGLVRRLNAELGQGAVLRVEIRGPQAPSWKRGKRTVRDGRGPRDTYG